jgi:hypothetical protein
MFGTTPLVVERAADFSKPPPIGQPHSVALPGSKKEGRSAVYRHWRFQDELLKTLDPAVRTTRILNPGTVLTISEDYDMPRGFRGYSQPHTKISMPWPPRVGSCEEVVWAIRVGRLPDCAETESQFWGWLGRPA